MFEVSQELVQYLESITAITNVVDSRIYAFIAPEDVQFPFITFAINQFEPESNDGDMYDVTVFAWFEQDKYKDAIQFTDVITNALKQNLEYNWEFSTFQFIEENISYAGIVNLKILK